MVNLCYQLQQKTSNPIFYYYFMANKYNYIYIYGLKYKLYFF